MARRSMTLTNRPGGVRQGRPPNDPPRVLVLGAGTRLLSAMSHYTIRITNALASRFTVAILPMRQFIPTFLYPGRSRVGRTSTRVEYLPDITVMGGVDWYWGPDFIRSLHKVRKWRPDVVVFEWWTGTVLHTYLAVAVLARLLRATLIVEFHEVLDTAEERIPLARLWVKLLGRQFFRLASGFVIHSEADRGPLDARYDFGDRPCVAIPHGPNDHHAAGEESRDIVALRDAPPDALNLLFFGIIRPYKGLEDLVRAFDLLDSDEAEQYWLTVVGETWEGWHVPISLIRQSRYRFRISLINQFVDDDDVVGYFAGADAVVLPYHRSSASSPASVAMSNGLPLVITSVGGLPEAVADYDGAILIPPRDPVALRDALRRLPELRGKLFPNPHSWDRAVEGYAALISRLDAS
jgi:glycosyltransferase involved in cell wall biosynthesis